jgi:TctA family transporter
MRLKGIEKNMSNLQKPESSKPASILGRQPSEMKLRALIVFAVCSILALVVMHDATGVRQETGKQAKAINNMAELLQSMSKGSLTQMEALEEFVGHTGRQVFVGALLGIAVALVMFRLCP